MKADLRGSPAAGLHGTLDDLVLFARELLAPTLVAPETFAEATSVQFPGLAGVIPDLGRFDPNDWGLGFELKGSKQPHFSGTLTSPRTFGHWGGSGTFVWVDPEREPRPRRPHRPRLRRLGEGGLAALQRRSRAGANVKKLQKSQKSRVGMPYQGHASREATLMAVIERERLTTSEQAPERAIFVAADGRRARRLRGVGFVAAFLACLWVVGLAVGMLGFGSLPGVSLVKQPFDEIARGSSDAPRAERKRCCACGSTIEPG